MTKQCQAKGLSNTTMSVISRSSVSKQLVSGKRKKPSYKKGGPVSRVNEAGNYTKPGMRKKIFERIKAGNKGGRAGQWSARKAQMLARQYKKEGGGYK